MTPDELKLLDELLAKMKHSFRHTFCIVPGLVHDGYYIGIYGEGGKPFIHKNAENLEVCFNKCCVELENKK